MTYFCKAVFSVPRTKSTLFFHDSRESPHSALTFLYLSIFFYIFLGCFMMSLHFSVCISWIPKSKELTPLLRHASSAASSASQTCPEKHRERAQPDALRLDHSHFFVSVARLRSQLRISLRSSASRLTEPEKMKCNKIRVKCIEMQQYYTKFGKIRNKKKRCCCFFLARQLALRQRELCSREGAASSRPGFRMRLEISLIESLYIFVCLLT